MTNSSNSLQSENTSKAEYLYQSVLQREPDNSRALYSLGIIALQEGNITKAIELIEEAVKNDQNNPNYYNTLGLIYESVQKNTEAASAYNKAISIDKAYYEAYHNMAILFQSQGHYSKAVDNCRQAISIKPDFAQAYNTLAFSLEKQGFYEDAIENYKKTIQLKPDFVEAYNHLGVILNNNGRSDEAIEQFKQALQYDAEYAEVYNNMGIALKEQEQFAEAIRCFERAIQFDASFHEAYYNLANSLRDQGYCNRAIDYYKRAIQLCPDYAQAHWNLSLTHLLCGNFIEGWKGYKWRRNADLEVLTNYHCLGKPRWNGENFAGLRLLVHYEQGIGDNIQFIRYIPMIKSRGGTVIFETLKPLMKLLKDFPGIDELIEYCSGKTTSVEYDLYTSLLDMPYIFGTTLETIPADIPYIFPDAIKTEAWKEKINGPEFKIGIVWAGSPEHGNDRYRSCRLEHFKPLAKIKKICLFALQKGTASEQINQLEEPFTVINIAEYFDDFSDTAAAIKNLDLVISVDTSVLHLAGAMGKMTWGLLPFTPEWRWMQQREDSPWYPTVRLFRQYIRNDWDTVFRQVAEELKCLLKERF